MRRPILTSGADILFVLLLVTTGCLLVLGILNALTPVTIFDSPYFAVNVDRSVSEVFLYTQYFFITLLFALLAFQRRSGMMVYWCAVFTYFLMDDLLRLHEKGGMLLSLRLDLSGLAYGSLGERAPGEAIYYAAVGGLIVALALGAYRLGGAEFRKVSKRLAVYLTLFAVFAVGGDVIHHAFSQQPLSSIADLIEEGGEILSICLVTRYLFALTGERVETG